MEGKNVVTEADADARPVSACRPAGSGYAKGRHHYGAGRMLFRLHLIAAKALLIVIWLSAIRFGRHFGRLATAWGNSVPSLSYLLAPSGYSGGTRLELLDGDVLGMHLGGRCGR